MPVRCVVGGCSNTKRTGISLHRFPKDSKIRRIWTQFVRNTRSDFACSDFSYICSDHFEPDCFDSTHELKARFGLGGSRGRVLLPGKYPTIKRKQTTDLGEPSVSNTSSSTTTNLSTRPKLDVKHIHTASQVGKSSKPNVTERESDSGIHAAADGVQSSKSPVPGPSQPKKRRIASERRARKQVIEEILHAADDVPEFEEPENPHQSVEVSGDFEKVSALSVSCQTKDVTLPKRVYRRSKKVQASLRMKTKETQTLESALLGMTGVQYENTSVQCSLLKPPPSSSPIKTYISSSDESEPEVQHVLAEYKPQEPNLSSDSEFDSDGETTAIWAEEKYLVFRSCLLSLFAVCLKCTEPSVGIVKRMIGSMVIVVQKCLSCNFQRTWHSQPFIKDMPAGNLCISSCVLFGGASPTKTLRVFKHMRMSSISERTFFRHQEFLLQPAIVNVWERQQAEIMVLFDEKKQPLVLGGDGRADSPGHTAKFGSYCLMELKTGKVIDIQLVQKNEVNNSNAMELEGLKRSFNWLQGVQAQPGSTIKIQALVTDRHSQVQKWVREQLPEIKHYYDVWHISKSVKKKLTALAKKKGCDQVNSWIRNIINHIYWCAASTPDGDQTLIFDKFKSITNHVQNIHSGHEGELFKECAHDELAADQQKDWLKPGTKACELLVETLQKTHLHNGVKKMSPIEQTSSIEAFHALLNFFAPKTTVFSYGGMISRLFLSAMHYNENGNREKAVNRKGDAILAIDFPRAKQGDYTLRMRCVPPTFKYVDELLQELTQIASINKAARDKALREESDILSKSPPPLTSGVNKPTKEDALERQKSRFKKPVNSREGLLICISFLL